MQNNSVIVIEKFKLFGRLILFIIQRDAGSTIPKRQSKTWHLFCKINKLKKVKLTFVENLVAFSLTTTGWSCFKRDSKAAINVFFFFYQYNFKSSPSNCAHVDIAVEMFYVVMATGGWCQRYLPGWSPYGAPEPK